MSNCYSILEYLKKLLFHKIRQQHSYRILGLVEKIDKYGGAIKLPWLLVAIAIGPKYIFYAAIDIFRQSR
jgi:hypothetical protein